MSAPAALPLTVALLAALLPACATGHGGDDGDAVRVVILAGQSNMEGKARNTLFEYQAADPETAPFFAHLRDGDGWVERDDVSIDFLGRRGPLTLGYGSPDRTGVEYELGTVLGDALDDHVLLVKTAWGGRALGRRFRPPSRPVSDERLQSEFVKAVARTRHENEKHDRDDPPPSLEDLRGEYGAAYADMIAEVRATLFELDARFPGLAGRPVELAGFVWFQGWNDQYDGLELEYADNLAALVRDVRRDLDAPGLPVVVGVMGQNMSRPAEGAMKTIQDAQFGIALSPEFVGSVVAVRTDVLVDTAAEALYPTWRDDEEAWERVGSDHPYHYLGSAIWFTRMGRAFGQALLELMGAQG